jgi:hypothetical protein
LKYTGQTGRTFHTRYKEHIQAVRSNNSRYSNHILNKRHTYGTLTGTMDIIKIYKKGKHLNTLQKYHIYKINKDILHINNTYIDTYNPIFETLHQITHAIQSPTKNRISSTTQS